MLRCSPCQSKKNQREAIVRRFKLDAASLGLMDQGGLCSMMPCAVMQLLLIYLCINLVFGKLSG